MRRISIILAVVMILVMCFNVQAETVGTPFNYGEALQKSILFYEAQCSGPASTSGISSRISWRGDAQMTDGQKEGLDLTGGWVDAGDNIKFNLTAGSTAAMLAWGAIEYRQAYEKSGQLKWLLGQLRWINDFFIKCHPEPNVFWAQIGMTESDHSHWVPIEVTHLTNDRGAVKLDTENPGTEVAMHVAAAMAASSIVFRSTDPVYADKLLAHAEQLFEFGDTYRENFYLSVSKFDPETPYKSWSGFNDELTWGAIWLYKAKEAQLPGSGTAYIEKAKSYYDNLGFDRERPVHSYKWAHCYDDQAYGCYVLMNQIFPDDPGYKADVERWLNWWTVGGTEHGADGTKIPYTSGGHARLHDWGSFRYAALTSLLAFIYSDKLEDPVKKARYHDFAVNQINYILGKNPRNASYIVGFGSNYPQHPHHRTAHGSWGGRKENPPDNRHILYGALVGSVNNNDGFNDSINDYVSNEVAIDYNSGLVGALARMYMEFGGNPIPEDQFPLPDKPYEPKHEWAVFAGLNSNGTNGTNFSCRVENRTAWPARPTDKLKIRYFLTLDTDDISDVYITVKQTDLCKAEGPNLWDEANKVYYFTLDFTNTWIYPGCAWEAGGPQIDFLIGSKSNKWDPSNDWSFKNWDDTYKNEIRKYAPNIPMYNGDNFVKVSGNEPPGGPVFSPVPTVVPTPSPTGIIYGDMSGDGLVNSTDYTLLKRHLLGTINWFPPGPDLRTVDLNGDGLVNSTDLTLLKRYLLRIITVFPVETQK
ncbi:MAG: glycoside hydrolase family 9 protein [Bacillota bacterium]